MSVLLIRRLLAILCGGINLSQPGTEQRSNVGQRAYDYYLSQSTHTKRTIDRFNYPPESAISLNMHLSALILCLMASLLSMFSTAAPPLIPPAEISNYQQKWGWFIRFVDAFMYPNNTVEASKVNSTLFAEDVQGRVDLTSTFDGRELNTEVYYPDFSLLFSNF